MFTSSGPVRTTAVFASSLSLLTAHISVCLALKKLTSGSGDCSICLQGKIEDHSYHVSPSHVCLMGASVITANLSSCQSSNLVSESSRLQEYPIFTAVSTRRNKEAGLKGGEGRDLSETLWWHSRVTIPFLSPVRTHTLIPACCRRAIVSGTPS